MREGMVREFGTDMYTLLYLKWITNKITNRARGTLLNVMWQPGWQRGFGGRIDTYLCMAETLCCSPVTITTLLIGYALIKKKKF